MPIYEYKAFAPGGSTKSGIVNADTERDARVKLRRENLLVSKLTETRGGRRLKGKLVKGGPRTKRSSGRMATLMDARSSANGPGSRQMDIVTGMTRQLATLLGSGIALNEALTALVDQAEHRRVESLIRELREDIQQGANLADALGKHPGWFTPLYINMVRAGQAAGNLDTVLMRLADYMQGQRAMRRKIIGALTYPLMMIAIGMIVVTILMAKVVPEITKMLLDQDRELPPSTRILVAISDFFKEWWWTLIIGAILISFIFERIYRKNGEGRLRIDGFLLSVPVLGDLLRRAAVARFTRTLATLLQSGVPVIQSLEITQTVVGNRVIADATADIREKVVEGADIATPLKKSGVFPTTVGYMVAVGEQSGELEQMLDRIAHAYDEEIEIAAERFTSLLEPIMIVALAGVVGFIVFSIVVPILEIGQIS